MRRAAGLDAVVSSLAGRTMPSETRNPFQSESDERPDPVSGQEIVEKLIRELHAMHQELLDHLDDLVRSGHYKRADHGKPRPDVG
jgi:hypothetical protein